MMDEAWHGERLLAYPFREFIDLLLDAPGLVLDINGLAPRDDHRFGDPVVRDDNICVEYGVASRATVRSGRVIADYPYALSLDVRFDGRQSTIRLYDETRRRIAEMMMIARPVERALTAVKWRGTAASMARGALRIEIKQHIDPYKVLNTKNGRAHV